MKYLANGRWALIVALGILAICASQAQAGLFSALTGQSDAETAAAAAPSETASSAEPAKRQTASRTERRNRHAHSRRHRPERVAKGKADAKADVKTARAGKADDVRTRPGVPATAGNPGVEAKPALPDAIANANAQMAGPVAETMPSPEAQEAAPAPAAGASADQHLVASDELNELDKAAAADKPMPKVYRPVSTTQASAGPTEDVWSQTSLIGKIFVAFGGLLTVASAARMFIA